MKTTLWNGKDEENLKVRKIPVNTWIIKIIPKIEPKFQKYLKVLFAGKLVTWKRIFVNLLITNLVMICFLSRFYICIPLRLIWFLFIPILQLIDKWSILMIYTSVFVYLISLTSRINKNLTILSKILTLIIILFFISIKFIYFYITFEIRLIPIILIIFGYGYQPERIEATFYLLTYTIIFSLPLLFLFLILMERKFNFLSRQPFFLRKLFCLILFMAFLVKSPIFLLHFWLPKAHVEAPTIGSIFLAAVILKLGTIGILKLFYLFFVNLNIFLFLILGIIISRWLTCFQSDIKKLIAISSVVHINILLLILIFSSNLRILTSTITIVFHGIISANLFFIVGRIFYFFISRNIYFSKRSFSKLIYFIFLIFILINFGVPPILRIFSEIFLISSWFKIEIIIRLGCVLFSIFCGYFCLFLILSLFSGKKVNINKIYLNKLTSRIISIFVIFCVYWLIFY